MTIDAAEQDAQINAMQQRIHEMMASQWHKGMFEQGPPTILEMIEQYKANHDPEHFQLVAFAIIDGSHPVGYELAKELWKNQYDWEVNQHNPNKTQIFRGPIHIDNAYQLMVPKQRILGLLKEHYEKEHEDPLILIMSSGMVSLWSIEGERIA